DDGDFTYEWDAENRLIAVTPDNPTSTKIRVNYEYDYMGRRVHKLGHCWDTALNGGSGGWDTAPCEDLRFGYDGWDVLIELDGPDHDNDNSPDNTNIREFTWGLDLSGQNGNNSCGTGFQPVGIHAAGGIGGLLALCDTNGTATSSDDSNYIYFCDANGNVG